MTYNGCFGVFDGHGGDKAAQFCKERITDMLENHQNIETKTISSITEGKFPLQIQDCHRHTRMKK